LNRPPHLSAVVSFNWGAFGRNFAEADRSFDAIHPPALRDLRAVCTSVHHHMRKPAPLPNWQRKILIFVLYENAKFAHHPLIGS
jgi:hypothetical protein